MTRSPRNWLDPRVVRLVAFAGFAVLASLQWVRYVEGSSASRALLWSAAAVVTAALVLAAGRRPLALAGATVAGAALAVGASGLDLTYLEPNHVDELGAGIYRGIEALNSVRLPYGGNEPWVLSTLELAGAGLCWLAAVLASWPGGRGRLSALVILLIMVAAPVVSLGADKPVVLGLGLAVLVAGFVWVERLSRRPGLGLALLIATVAFVAVPLGRAADREEPWFDYKAFSENLTGADPVRFDWDHEYGPIDWDREGVELFRVDSELPRYWKVETLNTFDGRLWSAVPEVDLGSEPEEDLPYGPARKQWLTDFSVTVRALESPRFVGAGTTLAITDATEPSTGALVPGQWIVDGTGELTEGDSYSASAYVPQATADELADGDGRRGSASLPGAGPRARPAPAAAGAPARHPWAVLPGSGDRLRPPVRSGQAGRRVPAARPQRRRRRRPRAVRPRSHVGAGAAPAPRRRDALRLRARGQQPPARPGLPLHGDAARDPGGPRRRSTRSCSTRGAATASSSRARWPCCCGWAACPPASPPASRRAASARAANGSIRDTDAHSWVEVWFDDIGWVTFDPTPPATPARSQIAAIDLPGDGAESPGSDAASGTSSGRAPNPRSPQFEGPAGAAGARLGRRRRAAVGRARRRSSLCCSGSRCWSPAGPPAGRATPQGALAELERALRRAGRAAPPGTTLAALERTLGAAPGGYLGSLRAARYAPSAPVPDPAQRRAFRRELAGALGRGGRVRALYALPPTLGRPRTIPSPSSSADRATAS